MLGVCWTPSAVQGMQKMASTMPSNPEQLLGAILVRKDIFHRFETTMHDTCLDANNLLEYLFSLYNSTAAPAERENFPSPQSLGFMRRDSNHKRKSSGRGSQVFAHPPHMGNSQYSQHPAAGRLAESHQKKVKLDHTNYQGNMNYVGQHQDYNQSTSLKSFEGHTVFPSGSSNNTASSVKMELTPEVDSRHNQSSSPLPPFSQIRRQGSRPYSPASAQYSDTLATPPHEDGRHSLGGVDISVDHSGGDVRLDVESIVPGPLGAQETPKNVHGSSKLAKKLKKLKAMHSQDNSNNNSGEGRGRKKRNHQCFCGALFTRADNLKRHIRKCHEEKLEKLNSAPLDFEVDNNGAALVDFTQAFPASGQEGMESTPQPQDSSHDPQQQQQQQQQQQHQRQQQEEHHHHHHQQPQGEEGIKSAAGVKWSCFCGESFDDHRQLVEHTRTHENNT